MLSQCCLTGVGEACEDSSASSDLEAFSVLLPCKSPNTWILLSRFVGRGIRDLLFDPSSSPDEIYRSLQEFYYHSIIISRLISTDMYHIQNIWNKVSQLCNIYIITGLNNSMHLNAPGNKKLLNGCSLWWHEGQLENYQTLSLLFVCYIRI